MVTAQILALKLIQYNQLINVMKSINIKRIALAFYLLWAVSTSVSAQSTYAVTDTATNTTYNLTILNGAWTTASVASTLQAQPWWNNASLAQTISGLSANLWGMSYFPLVAYNAPVAGSGGRQYVSIQYWTNGGGGPGTVPNTWSGAGGYINDCPTDCPNTTSAWDWLIATGYTPSSGPSAINTNQSLVNTAQALQGTYALQNSVLANSFSYDCTVFGENNICVSGGGRNTAVSAENGLNNTSALLIAAYRALPSVRIGAYADQNLSVNNGGSTANLGNNTPLIGLFAAWNERQDGTGSELKVSAAYGQKNTTVTRGVVGSGATASESGSGSSQLNSQGFQVLGKHGFSVMQDVIVSPYVGIRYTQNNMGGYTEGTSATVTAPLTYSALNTNATTALAGLGASYRGIPKTNLFASAGVESDTNTANGSYTATGVTGLTPVNFNANPVRTRATATLGASYDVEKNQRLGITGIYRQESYQAVSTTTVMATYTVGF